MLKEKNKLEEETELYMKDVARLLLQKAITHHNDFQPESSKSQNEEAKAEEQSLIE